MSVLIQIVAVLLVSIGITLIRRNESDGRVRIVTTASLLMAGTLLVGSLSEDHYVLVLVPLFIGFSHARGYLRWWVAAVCFILVTGTVSDRLTQFHRLSFLTKQRSLGLALLIVAITVEALMRHGARRGESFGRLAHTSTGAPRSRTTLGA